MFLHLLSIELRPKYFVFYEITDWVMFPNMFYLWWYLRPAYIWLFSDMSIGIYGGINP